MSHAAVFEIPVNVSRTIRRPRRAPSSVLLASLVAAAVTTGLSVAAIDYAFTHIPEVDPNAKPAPLAALATIAAEAAASPAKLQVLTPPVYGPDVIDEAPAVPFVPAKAQAAAEAVDMGVLAQADGVAPACGDPCAAQAGYIVPDAAADTPPAMVVDDRDTDHATSPDADHDAGPNADRDAASGNDDGNAPPPPDMTVN